MSNRVSLLRQALQSFLLSVCPRVSYGRADPVAPFPRLVFDLPNSHDDGEVEVFLLDVDGWDDSTDTTALETLMAAVDGDGAHQNASGLHRGGHQNWQYARGGLQGQEILPARRRSAATTPAVHLPSASIRGVMSVPTTEQIENIQLDYGLVFINYGEVGQVKLGPTRGGGEFTASKTIREIEIDGRRGKTKGLQVIDEIGASLKVGLMDTSLAVIGQLMPHASYSGVTETITNDAGGIIDGAKYLTNVTMFAKVVGGGYKKITLYNAMNEADFVLSAAPKAEGVVQYEFHAHWDAVSPVELFEIEDISDIGDDTTKPTVITVP
ncbi:MAG: hypothetical protein U1E22_02340, partial [Coriobacteriia bacterium]|nr:hypothetical protein [Coriobacteriia bacterium]